MSELPNWLDSLFQTEVIDRVAADSRSSAGTPMGYSWDDVFHKVIRFGQANFDEPFGDLTSDDRALLYTRLNARRHLDELLFAGKDLFEKSDSMNRPTILDVGCGPFTAGLAIAAALNCRIPFRYYGFDLYASMRRLGERLADQARAKGGFHPETTYSFARSPADVDFGQISGDWTIIVTSYLLASPTLDVNVLIPELLAALQRVGPGPAALLFTNSAHEHANKHYAAFHDQLLAGGFACKASGEEKFLHTKSPKPMRYALFYRPACRRLEVAK